MICKIAKSNKLFIECRHANETIVVYASERVGAIGVIYLVLATSRADPQPLFVIVSNGISNSSESSSIM